MSRPDDIPEDVWDAAEDAFDTLLCNDIQASGTAAQFRIDSITPVARAILAERRRASKAAYDSSKTYGVSFGDLSVMTGYIQGRIAAAKAIAPDEWSEP
jgi:hypothetical protein